MRTIVFSLLACLFVMLSGCGSQEEMAPTSSIQSEGEGTILIKIVSPDRTGRLGKIVAIDRITVFVHEADGTEIIQKDLTHEGDRAKATLTVPAGDNRTVTINSYQGELIAKTGSDSDVDVKAGQTTTAEIAPMSFIPTLDIEGGATGTYTVKWTEVSSADTYTLQEDDNSAFSTPEVVYTGSNTSKSFTGKAEGPSYYYRVCATNQYGNSKWSSPHFVSLSEDGTIQIDIPWDEWDEGEGEGAKPVLSVVPLYAVDYSYYTTVTGDVENKGSVDAHNVVLELTARNASGAAMDQASKTIGDVPAGSKRFFSIQFTGGVISNIGSSYNMIKRLDYVITYDEGGPDTGTVEAK